MEILSPAGNMNLIDSAVKAKSNAVYGGFKNWNARNNATNFTKEEYNYAISLLHKNNIKFYLTLNNLVLDDEINDIINYLKQEDLIKPDAFIVADIGLINILKENFPNIEIHVSTQFGAHNLSDIRLLESLGVTRVILAREVTLEELKFLRKNTKIELETFIWGSQCLSFSGLCFFGSLINGGTGNRGKCLNLCRDNYKTEKKEGTLLYVSDMNCINLLCELKNIESLKIEGRRRIPKEIENVIREVKEKRSNGIQAGFLYGEAPDENKMINVINNRIKPIVKSKEMKMIDENDVFMKLENNKLVSFCSQSDENAYYVYSEMLTKYELDKKNYFIDIQFDEKGKVQEFSVTNYKGENTVIKDCQSVETELFEPKEFKSKLLESSIKDVNISKIKYIKPLNSNMTVSKELMNRILKYFKMQRSVIDKENKKNNRAIDTLYLQTDDVHVVERFKQYKNIRVIYEISSVEELKNIDGMVNKYNGEIIFRLPIFNWKSEKLKEYYKKLENQEIMFTRYSQIFECKDIEFKRKYTDYLIYSWNKIALQFLKDNGINEFSASPELSVKQNCEIFKDSKVQYILAGRPTLTYTRNCLNKAFDCKKCNKVKKNEKIIYNKSKELKFITTCKAEHRELYYEYPILNDYSKFDLGANAKFRFITRGFTNEQIEFFIKNVCDCNYYEKLKGNEEWKNSYECNLIEGRN